MQGDGHEQTLALPFWRLWRPFGVFRVPLLQEPLFPLGRQSRLPRVILARLAPRERVADGELERPQREAGGERPRDVDERVPGVLFVGRRNPERQVLPWRDPLLEEERLV